jgi:Gpi18-like mannosyltransferase
MVLVVWVDSVYVVGSVLVVAAVDEDSQSVAGGLFSVAGRVSVHLVC